MLDAHGFEELAIVVQFVGQDLHVGGQRMRLVDQVDLMRGRETVDAVPDPFGQIADAHLFDDVARIVDVREGFIETLADVQVVERFALLLVRRAFRVAENDAFELLDQQVEFQLAQIDEIPWRGRGRRECAWRREKGIGQIEIGDESGSTDEERVRFVAHFAWRHERTSSIHRTC